ncbi:efflux RND transporter periplasmic adaptor subunit [Rhodoferax sp. GW822-FHT02A01]|uniref:efflux RND transporter periplasmic adaptor subunit n=1 Tax=Rhodoferax sp. GW822-FHT02A01 TaxID=3141537 RepID=UPI00315DAB98
MKISLKWVVAGVVTALLAAGVLRALSSREAAKQAQQTAQKQQTFVEIAPSDMLQAQTVELTQTLHISGSLKAVNSAFVKAKVAGELLGLNVREGDYVKAGQVIARVDTSEYQTRVHQAQQQAESAKGQLDIAQRTLDNNKSLVDQGFISRTALDNSLNNLASAQATYKAAQAGADLALKSLDDTILKSPINGQISQRLVQNGERVAIDARVVEVVDLGSLELEAALGAADSVRVQTGQTAQLVVEGLSQPVTAKVARVNPSTVAGSRSVMVYFSVSNTPGLRQGLFAQGTLAIGNAKVLAVPLDAVRTDKPQPYVQYIADGKVAHQSVRLGAAGEHAGIAMVEIQGLPEGAAVLAGNAGALLAGTPVKRLAGTP